VRLEGLGKLKKSTSSGIRTSDIPACSIVPQPTTLPRDPLLWMTHKIIMSAAQALHCIDMKCVPIKNAVVKYVSMKAHTHEANDIEHQRVCEFVHETRASCLWLYLPQIS
jgi:hypothetical protein